MKYLTSLLLIYCLLIIPVSAQDFPSLPGHVLNLQSGKTGARNIPQDQGMSGVWQKLQKLTTTASVLHTVAHPDDEQADMITQLSRGKGVRTSLLSLNRGEGGANVLGSEIFDGLGLLRTEELLLAGAYYGLDDLYFTDVADYGYSKRVEEAYEKWGKEQVLKEMVRVIRINRPMVIVSRFHGSERDGHGNHQAAGELTPEAFRLAGDPNVFPEQITEGLRPWKALKVYRGGVKADEPWQVSVETGEYSPWLGDTYGNFAFLGYSFHRSQFGGVRFQMAGSSRPYYERLDTKNAVQEKDFFEGIDTSLPGIFKLTGETAPKELIDLLSQAENDIKKAIAGFQPAQLSAVIPPLTSALSNLRKAISLSQSQKEALFLMQIKERQVLETIHAASGIEIQAMALPMSFTGTEHFYQPPPVLEAVVPGQTFKVQVSIVNNSNQLLQAGNITLQMPSGWQVQTSTVAAQRLEPHEKTEQLFTVTAAANTPVSQAYFTRNSLQENRYQLKQKSAYPLPLEPPVVMAVSSYIMGNEKIQVQQPVLTRKVNLPYGYSLYTLKVLPEIAVNVQPASAVIPLSDKPVTIPLQVELLSNADGNINGKLRLKAPSGWKITPEQTPFAFAKAGEKNSYTFQLTIPKTGKQTYELSAVATVNGKDFSMGYTRIEHQDLDYQLLFRPSTIHVSAIDVKIAPGLTIGYIMGAGDDVPKGLEQLGAKVQLLSANDLAAQDLQNFNAILIGTRAYAVRPELQTYHQRLMDYVKAGGNLIVLYQTQEFVPEKMAPYTASLPFNAEETSEENSSIQILSASHPALNTPNKITLADFDNWVEQRGSKFFSTWDAAYTPIISTQDHGQAPQKGGWLMATYGKGNYTYFAYALHRQLPYGVPGAYRILANLVSLGKK
ncbi:PIG-L family deacetylase [Rhodocytophaga rosea]|uniref:PIG-L family deacetylase n=1 Tax=Rhodocytophaga rosea TaxID=2704465 RepID=A0A6C0GN58_9BACT|nr:PIG-L family deacetylase [Rhodocytophaga rosea]QHT69459.1 PIG-L family deacetylase [Rhodocytophaga rosea]